ncbi:glycosyltransferase family 1 protein [Patellaria atrata CBS 101060]|uniref:Glycosyltransferase family 1 protein n=1 Tax=Patellaria atrata CBS 101060 TaxID=1346257 RepID=A0A9P4SCP7_9PEZI|nr:glycosyltransferase family 1 protein [Patellaria atrata CBS 101060]
MTTTMENVGDSTTMTNIPPGNSTFSQKSPKHGMSFKNNNSLGLDTQLDATVSQEMADGHTTPQKSATAPAASRPALDKKWATERPQASTRASLLGMKRRGTAQLPKPNRAYTYNFEPSSDSSSSSSSDSETSDTEDGLNGTTSRKHRTENYNKSKIKKKDRSSDPYSRFSVGNEQFRTKGKVSKRDGRLKISVNETANRGYLAKALGTGIRHHLYPGGEKDEEKDITSPVTREKIEELEQPIEIYEDERSPNPKLNIVVIVIGSRGDIQPFLKIGKVLKEEYGHRVRIATHPAFKNFVEQDSGLEFFSVGGNPSELMAFMVKNPGLIPSMETVKAGEIGRRRASMYEMFNGMWRACINATDDESDKVNAKMMGENHPFIADAIIANPPSFAHYHIAERLGVPLHMMFTFPYTPTTQFPHPLANIKASNVDREYTNFMSYPLVEMMTWQGLGDLVNKFRVKTLGLEPVSTLWAPGQLYRLNVPYTYMWSPSLVPKPPDWGPEIDIGGFVFLDLASSFKPSQELMDFLNGGEVPVYIGFGSIVVDAPDKFTKMIFDAVKMAGVRALVSKGWGGLGDEDNTPDNIFMLDNTPHDWLFPRVSAVVHHGGAGTTAIGLKCGKPTMIVPFFGDQPFWGAMVAQAKAGAHNCIPYKKLTAEKLAEGIKQCLTDEARENVGRIAESIAKEGDGAQNAVRSFHRSLRLRGGRSMRCSILDDRIAAWQLKSIPLRLSPLAAYILVERKSIKWNDLRLLRHHDWNDFEGPGEPLTGGTSAVIGTVTDAAKGVGLVPLHMARSVKHRVDHNKKKKRHQERKAKLVTANQDTNGALNGQDRPHSKEGVEEVEESLSLQTLNSRPHPQRAETMESALSADPSENIAEQLAHDTSHGFKKTGVAIAKAPMDLSLAIAQGFHNAPRLYGDETVRRPVRVEGLHSGLRAGRDEFVYGIHDGVKGLWWHPYQGAKERGVLGCLTGVGVGIGGVVLKSSAAMFGPAAYGLKGLHKELRKKNSPTGYMRRVRIMQGQKDLQTLQRVRSEIERHEENVQDDELARVRQQVTHAWEIVTEILEMKHKRIVQGGRFRGHFMVKKAQKEWEDNDAAENIQTAEMALDARKRGLDFYEVFKKHREDVAKANAARMPTMESGKQPIKKIGAGTGQTQDRKLVYGDDKETRRRDLNALMEATDKMQEVSGVEREVRRDVGMRDAAQQKNETATMDFAKPAGEGINGYARL